MTAREFVDKLIDIEKNYKTVYGMGMPGMPITDATIKEKVKQSSWWKPVREIEIRKLIGKGYFGFDCICLAKAILWGWSGDFSKRMGGAKYLSNNVPDWGADYTNRMGIERSTDFSKIELGHYVWMTGHIGFYIGDGLVIEASPKWKNGVQKTAVLNIGKKAGYNGRTWTTHGKLAWVDYAEKDDNMLKKGDKNEAVKYFQTLLLKAGYDLAQYGADGSFGGVTVRAVEALQSDAGLTKTGRLDIYTIMALIDRTGTADGLERELEEAKEELKGYKGFFARLKEYLS